MIAWGLEMVQHKRFDFIRISFMIAGHTKFAPDILFSKVSKSYSVSDLFTKSELCHIAESFTSVVVDDGHIVCKWRDALSKYTKLPGIRSLHDFVCVRKPSTGNAHVCVRDVCYEGAIRDSNIKVSRGHRPTENVIPGEEDSYMSTGTKKEINGTKLTDLFSCITTLFRMIAVLTFSLRHDSSLCIDLFIVLTLEVCIVVWCVNLF